MKVGGRESKRRREARDVDVKAGGCGLMRADVLDQREGVALIYTAGGGRERGWKRSGGVDEAGRRRRRGQCVCGQRGSQSGGRSGASGVGGQVKSSRVEYRTK